MELTTSQDILVRGLQKIQGIVERKNTLPILSHFLLTAKGDETIIHATDLELGYKGYLDTTVNKPGTATLPARKTYDILRELPAGGQVTLTVETQGWAYIKAGSAEFKVPCLPAEEYPALPPVEEAEFSSLDSEVLEEMIRQTIFATSHDETRYTLSGVLMVCDSKEMTWWPQTAIAWRIPDVRCRLGENYGSLCPGRRLRKSAVLRLIARKRLWTWRRCRTIWCSGRAAPRW